MILGSSLLGCLLLGQVAPAADLQVPLSPPQIVAKAVALPGEDILPGEPLRLSHVLTVNPNRGEQVKVVQAYWTLSEAVAALNRCRERAAQLALLTVRAGDESALLRAREAAAAAREEALVAVTTAQHAFAEQAGLSVLGPLPLPTDVPHAGPYRTRFEEMFAGRPIPSRSRLIATILPIRFRAIEHRARSVEAAQKAVTAASQRYAAGEVDLDKVLSAMERSDEAQQVLIQAVCQYNREIVDYVALAVDRPLEPETLVSLLIQTTDGDERPMVAVRPSGALGKNVPTLAPPRDGRPRPTGASSNDAWHGPTKAPPRSGDSSAENGPPAAPGGFAPSWPEKNVPTPAPPRLTQPPLVPLNTPLPDKGLPPSGSVPPENGT
ncbi:MAG: hypothetical protein JW818_07320, partial [Pirellulales bacterium]|nr:hypothetical protein [Pirellulales bacterium]